MLMLQQAKWIAAAKTDWASPLFRKSFCLDRAPVSATLKACCLGYGVITVNGRPVTEDVLTTPLTKFDSSVLYNTYEIASLLRAGENVIGIMLGNGWYNDISETWDFEKASWRHHPKLILSLLLQWPDMQTREIRSDSSWETAGGPAVFNHVRCGERFDARLAQEGFDCPGFDAGSWQNAFVCRSPGGILKPAQLPPIRITDTLPMKEIAPSLYDCGQNLSGWAKIRVKGEQGQKISIHYGEQLTPEGKLDSHINCFNKNYELNHCDEYICAGSGWEEWEPHFCYHGFRYASVEGAPEDFEITARLVRTGLESIGSFSCSDEMLNRIHHASRWSTMTNYHGVPTDCPHREQNGWTGDALLSSEQALMNFDMVDAYSKWLADFRDCQRPSGQLPGIVPTAGWGFNWGSGPAWDSALILIPLYVWRYRRNDRLLRENWDAMERYMGYFSSMTEDGLAEFGLGDWCHPKDTIPCPTMLTDTAYYYADARAMAEAAAVLGKNPAPYQNLADQIRCAFRTKFLKNGLPQPEGQTALACVLFQGLLDEEEKPGAAARLAQLVEENGFHIDCGILGTKYIFRALSDAGFGETLYKMVTNPSYPSYAYWMEQGMTTLCEDWEMDNSLNHHMFSEVDLWFYRYLAGIQTDGGILTIAPLFLEKLDWVKARHRDISVAWDRSSITVTVPEPAVLILSGKKIPLQPGTTTLSRNA